MAINSVNPSTQRVISGASNPSRDAAAANVVVADSKRTAPNGAAAVYEKSDQTAISLQTYARDTATLN